MNTTPQQTAEHLRDEMRAGKPHQRYRPHFNAFLEATEVSCSPNSDAACKRHYRKVCGWMVDNWKREFASEGA